mmetsp:Transcript_17064/g.27614  ORF Transcript_17064/g.27614 Transcript_17064/m.27614 type:complete len:172 (+) Transcript_17064:154-669(+)|eukprot:CAMPEP_0203777470 /NCGR_PEP_ID=MMETSP0099_2-20121227/7396_1 /ASSEMBLY_ACC=CAM_ASM_000209 /TAXON_ID=96639 /ORGANISM=" , Strain NY0313808BC1" /LENGTH=171 /DNA_ID=CAMNT_0050676745 /DNA_START=78 /DNA_END=593 /DNA_ORIENTATION=-
MVRFKVRFLVIRISQCARSATSSDRETGSKKKKRKIQDILGVTGVKWTDPERENELKTIRCLADMNGFKFLQIIRGKVVGLGEDCATQVSPKILVKAFDERLGLVVVRCPRFSVDTCKKVVEEIGDINSRQVECKVIHIAGSVNQCKKALYRLGSTKIHRVEWEKIAEMIS